MAKAKKDARWNVAFLKSRGWTESLIAELLPAPVYRPCGRGGRTRTWRRGDVEQAEGTERFRSGRSTDAEQALAAAVQLLTAAWNSRTPDSGRAGLLAQHYHNAILHQLRHAAWADTLRAGKAASYVSAFLALEHRGTGDCGSELRRFVSAGVWIGRNPGEAPVQQRGSWSCSQPRSPRRMWTGSCRCSGFPCTSFWPIP